MFRQRKKNTVWFHLDVAYKETKSKQNENRIIDTENEQVIASGEEVGGGKIGEGN